MSEEGCGCLGALAIIYAVFQIIINVLGYIATAAVAIAVLVLGILLLMGAAKAIGNLRQAFIKVNADYKAEGRFKTPEKRKEMETACPSGNYNSYIYEEVARPLFFFGGSFIFVKNVVKESFIMLSKNKPVNSGGFWGTIAWFSQIITFFVGGVIFNILFSIILIVGITIISIIMWPVSFIVAKCNEIRYNSKGIKTICPGKCKKRVDPVYICPKCSIQHVWLKPGFYGIWKRECVCGATIPLTMNGKARYVIPQPGGGIETKELPLKDFTCKCPDCGAIIRGNMSKPIGLALIGGKSAGKTTFKTAFINDFLKEKVLELGIDYEFPETDNFAKNLEKEFELCTKQYSGSIPIGATNVGRETDITTFEFIAESKKLPARKITLYDMPGEVFLSGQAKEGWNLYEFNDGVIFLIDPYTLNGVEFENKKELAGSTMGRSDVPIDDLIQALIETLRTVNAERAKSGKYTLPVALTINKVDTDLLKKQVGENAMDAMMRLHPDVFKDKYVTTDFVCRCFLAQKEGEGFIQALDNYFENVHFFYSSPMGYVPKGRLSRFNPINIMPVMQWLITRADREGLGKIWNSTTRLVDLTKDEKMMYQNSQFRQWYEDYYNSVTITDEK